MSIDFNELMLGPIFDTLAVSARLVLEDGRVFADFPVIDKTAGVTTGDKVEVPTVQPAAAIQYATLTALGMTADDIIGGTLTFNGASWLIRNKKLDPNPSGERMGQIYAMLEEADELASSES